jgi:ABC-type transporter Mla subunit MlaD
MANAKLTSLIIKIAANGASAQAELKALEREVGKFAKNMERLGSTMSKYLTAPLVAAGAVAVNAANTQMQAEARLLTALKGREDIQGRLLKQAAELQSRSIYGDEAVIEQQAFLAALGLTESQINATINAAAQLSAALGMEFSSAVRNLSKTYSGLAGELGESIPALRELTQEEMKAGGAIAYVNNNYKGFAETMATTGMGPLQQLKNSLGDLAEQFGTILVPIVQKLATHLKEIVERFQQLSPRTRELITSAAALAAAFGPLTMAFGKVLTHCKSFIALTPKMARALAANPMIAAAAAVAGLALAWKNAKDNIAA